ncbi:MAG: hypothetical protein DRP63_00085 [Planctomycetota bacterium]|nr:MAG: hypothetical protein DRP63_00085 [Planctomycetota bacterium]
MGKLMPRYCNVCGRLVTPREIERGNAIVYGMHCYCAKCKDELMPIIEALKKRSQKENAQKRQQKQKKAKLQKATRTEFFFHRPDVRKRREPAMRQPSAASEPVKAEVVEAESVPQNAYDAELEPVDFSKLKPVGKEVPLPPGAVKIGNRLIEVTPDGIRQQISPPRGPSVRSSRTRRPSTRHRISPSSATARSANKLHSAPTKRNAISGSTLALILLIAGIGGGLLSYLLVRRHSAGSSASGGEGIQQSEGERQLARQIQALRKQVRTLSNPSDWLPLKRRIKKLLSEAKGSQKTRLERLLAEGEAWFKQQERRKAGQQRHGAEGR